MSDWQYGKPPNEQIVEVEENGKVIRVMAFHGRDGYRAHLRPNVTRAHHKAPAL